MSEGRATNQRQDAAVRELASRIATSLGLTVYDIVFRRSGPRWKLQVFLDRPQGSVTLADCEAVSRQFSRELDVLDPIEHAYDLEVSSPGIERPIREPWHWERAAGERVAVRWRDAAGKTQTVVARLARIEDDRVVLEPDGGEAIEVPLRSVLAARIHVDW